MVGVTTGSMNTLETVMKPARKPRCSWQRAAGPSRISCLTRALDQQALVDRFEWPNGQIGRVGGLMRRALGVAAVVILAACGGDGATEVGPDTTGSIRGTVTDNGGSGVANAVITLTGNAQAARTTNSGANGVYTFAKVPPGTYTLAVTSAAGFVIDATGTVSVTVADGAEANASAFVLTRAPVAPGGWGLRAGLLVANSEFALAESNGKIYVMGGYPASRQTSRTVQIYDIASDRWQLGPELPHPNNHGMAAAVSGKIYLIGGQTTDDQEGATAVDQVFELDPAKGAWVEKARMPTARSGGVAVVHGGKIYVAGGRVPRGSDFAVYDPAADRWVLGPPLPQPNNHGMAAGANGRVYLIGGQTLADEPQNYVDTVYELDPAKSVWVEKARMPTARSSGVAVVHDGRIYVAGGRPPRGSDFAVYDPKSDSWQELPNLPSQRNHLTGAAIKGRIHVVGGRLGQGLSPQMTTVNEVFDPQTGSWTTVAAPMLRARSGMNGVMARGCFHVWGGEGPSGMFPDHDYYDPRTNQWIRLRDMPTPVHGVYGSAFVGGLIWAPGGGTNIGGNFGSLHNQVFMPTVSCE